MKYRTVCSHTNHYHLHLAVMIPRFVAELSLKRRGVNAEAGCWLCLGWRSWVAGCVFFVYDHTYMIIHGSHAWFVVLTCARTAHTLPFSGTTLELHVYRCKACIR